MAITYLDEPQIKKSNITYLDESTPITQDVPLIRSPFKLNATPQDSAQIGIGDITSGQMIPKAFNYLAEQVKRPVKTLLERDIPKEIPQAQTLPMLPTDIGSAMLKAGTIIAPKIFPAIRSPLIDIVSDPRTYLPTGPARRSVEAVGKKVAGMAKGAEEIAVNVGELPSKLARGWAGIPSGAVKWIKQRGSAKIFDPLKEKVDYIKTTLVPKIFPMYQKRTQGLLDEAGNMMSKSMNKIKGDSMDFTKTLSSIRDTLDGYGLLDTAGKVVGDIKDREIPSAVKLMGEMYQNALAKGKTTPILSKSYFDFYRKALRSSQKGAGAFKGDVQKVINNLYIDAESAGAKGINTAKEAYHKAMDILDEFEMSPDSFASKINQAVNPKEWTYIKEKLKPVFGKQTDEIFANIKDHAIVQLFSKHGGGPMGLFKGISQGVKLGLREFYEKGLPKIPTRAK